jgi:hypothetical protein
MTVSIGSNVFNDMKGPPPKLREAAVMVGTKPGGGVGGRVQPATGKLTEVTVVAIVANSARLSTQYGYRTAIGTVVDFVHNGVTYSTTYLSKFFVVDVEVIESVTLSRACGQVGGTPFNHAPGARITSRWKLLAIPFTPPP